MAKIYIASSWRNAFYTDVVTKLREAGHDVYDFRNPPHGKGGFHWSDVDPNFQNWTVEQYAAGLKDPWSEQQFKSDLEAMEWATRVSLCFLAADLHIPKQVGLLAEAAKQSHISLRCRKQN